MSIPAKRCAIYLRVSSKGQAKDDRYGLPNQLRACRAYAATQGWAVVGVYAEKGQQRSELHRRPEMTQLRAAAKRGELDVVLCLTIDRLSSNENHVAILDDEFERAGVQLDFVDDDFERSPIGRMIRSAKVFAAALEHEKIRDRTQGGRRLRAESGKPLGCGPIKYGLRYRDAAKTGYDPDPATVGVVRRVFDLADAGVSIRQIGLRLQAEGLLPPHHAKTGNPTWSSASVRRILTETAYTGTGYAYRHHTEKLPNGTTRTITLPVEHPDVVPLPAGVYPVVIGRAQFERVQWQLAANVRESQRHDRDPEIGLFRRGFIVCGHCGHSVVVKASRSGPTYTCNGSHRWGCGKAAMMVHHLDAAVWPDIEEVLNRPEVVERRLAQLAEHDTTGPELAAIEERIAGIEQQQTMLAKGIAALGDEDAAAPLLARLTQLAPLKKHAEGERTTIVADRAAQAHSRARLQQAIDYTAEVRRQVADEHATLSWDAKRHALAKLQVRVVLFPEGHAPRWAVRMQWADADAATGQPMPKRRFHMGDGVSPRLVPEPGRPTFGAAYLTFGRTYKEWQAAASRALTALDAEPGQADHGSDNLSQATRPSVAPARSTRPAARGWP